MQQRVHKDFWKIVKQIIRDNYELLMTERLRQGYYIVRDKLKELIGKTITREDFDYFANSKTNAYNYYTQDVWTQLEREGRERPEAKPVGSLWTHGGKFPIEDFYLVWDQARGFIFTEKSGEKLEPLTKFGWMIIEPEKGFPSRLIREKCKEDGRPVLAVHDGDISGEGIARALGETTRRTTHLDISIDDVTNLGLRWEDVKRLNLPTIPEVKKHRQERADRCELESMTTLKSRHGIENPFLDYVIVRMMQEGISISPTSKSKMKMIKDRIVAKITSDLEDLIVPIVGEVIDGKIEDYAGGEDQAVSVDIPTESEIDLEELEEAVRDISSKMEKVAEWEYEKDYEARARGKVSKKFLELMGGKNA